MTNKNNTTSKATETKAAETVYTIAARAASAFGRSVTSKALAAAGMDTKEARAAFMAYKDNATALITALADARAEVSNNGQPSEATKTLVSAASRYMGYFAADKAARAAALFEGKKESNIAVATRISAALGAIAVNGTAKTVDGLRRGTINAGKDGNASTTARAALEQWALDCLDNVASLNADAMIEDKKAKAEARAEKLAAEKEAIAQAAEDMKKKTGKAA